jgi:hypothetical protein
LPVLEARRRAAGEQQGDEIVMAALHGAHERGDARVVRPVRIGLGAQERLGYRQPRLVDRPKERGLPGGVRTIGIGAMVEQKGHDRGVALSGRREESVVAISVA